jgi:hypothetical protein
MQTESNGNLFDLGDRTALVCVDQQPYQKMIATQLVDLQYKVHLGLFEEDVLLKLSTYSYNVVVIAENFKGSSAEENPILAVMIQRSGALRREHFVVLLSQRFQTNDAMSAFVQSVDQIINFEDVANFKPVIRRGLAQYNDLYGPFRETLKAVESV